MYPAQRPVESTTRYRSFAYLYLQLREAAPDLGREAQPPTVPPGERLRQHIALLKRGAGAVNPEADWPSLRDHSSVFVRQPRMRSWR
ncbi:hypothetical protein CBM2626_B140172 [Cupriavidus taiwanensis]|nr:hypothetical protein CBM2626_B140172 [Cupriavidus taiwanensis]